MARSQDRSDTAGSSRAPTATSWSTQQLTDLLVALAELPDQPTIMRSTLEHVADALRCQAAALVVDREVLDCIGLPAHAVPSSPLLSADAAVDVPDVGPCAVTIADCAGLPGGRLLLVRTSRLPFSEDERALLRGVAQVLGLSLQGRRLGNRKRSV